MLGFYCAIAPLTGSWFVSMQSHLCENNTVKKICPWAISLLMGMGPNMPIVSSPKFKESLPICPSIHMILLCIANRTYIYAHMALMHLLASHMYKPQISKKRMDGDGDSENAHMLGCIGQMQDPQQTDAFTRGRIK